jgi:hypothetical protein
MKKIFFLISFFIVITFLLALPIKNTYASDTLLVSENTSDGFNTCIQTGTCELKHLTILMIRVSQIILGLTGSLSLLAFVYGGTLFLISSGNKEMVEKGKNTIIGAVIGIFIVFLSYTVIGYIFTSIGISEAANWNSSNWFNK